MGIVDPMYLHAAQTVEELPLLYSRGCHFVEKASGVLKLEKPPLESPFLHDAAEGGLASDDENLKRTPNGEGNNG